MTAESAPVAIVTGGARGMGRAHVAGLAKAGFRVVALDNSADALELLAREAAAEMQDVDALACDVTSEADIARAFTDILARLGRIDVLVNNAGGALHGAKLADTSLADWDATVRLNLTSQFLCIRAVIPAMTQQGGGSIINVATTSAFSGVTAALRHGDDPANLVAYVAAKGGVVGLTRALARELGPQNIRINAVAPGFTPTPRVRERFSGGALERMVADQALSRAQQADDATGAVVFLASPAAQFVTGQVIRVDGGGSMG